MKLLAFVAVFATLAYLTTAQDVGITFQKYIMRMYIYIAIEYGVVYRENILISGENMS